MMSNKELKEFRLMLGLNTKEAGEMMYLTKQAISAIECGKSNQKSTMYLMELCYTKYFKEHKNEIEKRLEKASNLFEKLSGEP